MTAEGTLPTGEVELRSGEEVEHRSGREAELLREGEEVIVDPLNVEVGHPNEDGEVELPTEDEEVTAEVLGEGTTLIFFRGDFTCSFYFRPRSPSPQRRNDRKRQRSRLSSKEKSFFLLFFFSFFSKKKKTKRFLFDFLFNFD